MTKDLSEVLIVIIGEQRYVGYELLGRSGQFISVFNQDTDEEISFVGKYDPHIVTDMFFQAGFMNNIGPFGQLLRDTVVDLLFSQ